MNKQEQQDYTQFLAIKTRVDSHLAARQYDASRIKIECVKLKISITDFAKVAGVSRVHLSEMIHGRKKPKPKTLNKILTTIELLKTKQNEKV